MVIFSLNPDGLLTHCLRATQRKKAHYYFNSNEPFFIGAGEMNRTPDLLITNDKISLFCIIRLC